MCATREAVGLVPAAGRATRIAPLPCSKEIFPVGFRVDSQGGIRPKAVCDYLLEKMRLAGITKAYIVLRDGKWDIPAYLGDGSLLHMDLAYLMMRLPYGVPYTLDQAYPFVQHSLITFGFPDILFSPDDAFVHALDRQAASHADVVLGLFPARETQNVDMVNIENSGRVRSLVIKPLQTHLRYTWMFAVWTPVFTQFMHQRLAAIQEASTHHELSVGEVIQAAIDNDLRVDSVLFTDDSYRDIGTPDDLVKAVREAEPQRAR